VAAAAAALLLTALPASAHVTVSSPDASPGGFGKLVFRVPTESENASTTKVTVQLPRATPFAFVSSRPIPGWKVTTTERRLDKPVKAEGFTLTKAVGTVTWTAAPGQGLGPGQFEEFELSVGPFPEKPASLVLPATQTYSDGQVVQWDQPTPAGGKEPEHPAPTLDVSQGAPAGSAAPADSSDDLARWLGGGGLLLGALALVSAFMLGRRGGRSS
jgi:periplasmic copper chaperone A